MLVKLSVKRKRKVLGKDVARDMILFQWDMTLQQIEILNELANKLVDGV